MKDKLMALVVIALVIEVLTIVIISFLAMIGAMNLTDGCMYRYPLTGNNTTGDAMVANITLKANGNYTSATTTASGSIVQVPTPGPQQFSDGTSGYTYGQWLKTDITVGKPVTLGVSGTVSLCRAYLPANNLESTSSTAVYALPSNSGIVSGSAIPIPRVEEATPAIQLLFDASNSGGWRNLTKVGFQDELQVTIGDNPVAIMQGTVTLNNLNAMTFQSMFSGTSGTVTGNCSDNRTTYSPVCNRYTPYNIPGQQYVTDCEGSIIRQLAYNKSCPGSVCSNCYNMTDPNACCNYWAGKCWDGWCTNVIHTGCSTDTINIDANYWQETPTSMPQPYTSSGTYTWAVPSADVPVLFPYGTTGFLASTGFTPIAGADGTPYQSSNICAAQNSDFTLTTTVTPGTWPGAANGSYLGQQYFWLASNSAIGLYERNNGNDATVSPNLGSNHKGVKLITGQSTTNLIKSLGSAGAAQGDAGYLQYRFMTIGDSPPGDGTPTFNYNSGGYIISLKQTACRAIDGVSILSTTNPSSPVPSNTNPYGFAGNIGDIRYLVLDSGIDPNKPVNASALSGSMALPGGASFTFTPAATSSNTQTMWLKIANNPANYADSFGQYNVNVYTVVPVGAFSNLVLNNILVKFKSIVISAATKMFEHMTCMNCESNDPGAVCTPVTDQSGCNNFFMYIKAMLTLYVMLFGMMFLLGMVKISNQDFVIRIVKIALVAGLLSGDTLRFFNNYVFDFVTGFSDEMIANLSGYASNAVNVQDNVSNPFMFLDALMSRIFFSKTFFTQVLALLSLGISGAFYFIIVFIALVVLIITVFRAISIYIMAFMAVALLLGLAPLFLTFLLFEKSFYLFENWVRFLFRYMMEPVILMAGITILTQLFTVYLDYVLSYSVCWKCGLVFKIPFAGIPGLSMFQDLPLFCINWFTPWGLDNSGASGMMGMNLQNMIALVMIAYAMYGYTEISGALVGRLTSTMLAPSMTATGGLLSGAIGQKMLKQVGMDSESRDNRARKYESDAAGRRHEVKKLLDDQKKWPASGKPLSTGSSKGSNLQLNQSVNPASGGPLNPNATKPAQPTAAPQPFANPGKNDLSKPLPPAPQAVPKRTPPAKPLPPIPSKPLPPTPSKPAASPGVSDGPKPKASNDPKSGGGA